MKRQCFCRPSLIPEEEEYEAAQREYDDLGVKRDRAEAAASRARLSAEAAWMRQMAAFDVMMERLQPGWAAKVEARAQAPSEERSS